MKLSDFDYDLPEELIAQTPLEMRDRSRLLVLNRSSGEIEHGTFTDILDHLNPNDCLVLNDTRVLPARLIGEKDDTKIPVELLLIKQDDKNIWEAMVRPGRRLKEGALVTFVGGLLRAEIIKSLENGNRQVHFFYKGDFFSLLQEVGQMPLPPYIHEKLDDKERYQTIFNKNLGSAAAPTAGLHFTPELLEKIRLKGINIVTLTLHVGIGTFRPVKSEDILQHNMHSEFFSLGKESAEAINRTKKAGGRVICVGTTSVRTLESVASEDGFLEPKEGYTDIFIYPGYKFKIVDGLITNFHLPKSTLLMLISAFAGREQVLNAYSEAVREKYRFFSFGDAMLIE